MTGQHGGSRPGAGRKPKLRLVKDTDRAAVNQDDALVFLLACVNDKGLDAALRIKAAGLVLASGRRGKVAAREQAKAEKSAAYTAGDGWQNRLMQELNDETTSH
ncbi:MAG: hypothetical protein Q8O52_01660 [Sulfuritalea sp.]|nr:hypothetical protein [Sulfuritalea sp.]